MSLGWSGADKSGEFSSGVLVASVAFVRYTSPITVREASDITASMLPMLTELVDDYYPNPDEKVEWDTFADILERDYNIVIPDFGCPAFRKIQRIVRKLREQDGEITL